MVRRDVLKTLMVRRDVLKTLTNHEPLGQGFQCQTLKKVPL
jgi:hypothetical protein